MKDSNDSPNLRRGNGSGINPKREPERGSQLDRLNTRLYSKNQPLPKTKPSILSTHQDTTPSSWLTGDFSKETIKPATPRFKSGAKTFFIFTIIFLIVSLLFAGYMFFVKGVTTISDNNISITVLGNAFTPGGEELPLQIEVTNQNREALQNADLLVEYPKGAETNNNLGDMVRNRISVGTIESGRTLTQVAPVILFGNEGSVKNIKITLEYRVINSNAIYKKEKNFNVTVSSAPIDIVYNAPTAVTSGQEFDLIVKVTLHSSLVPNKFVLKMEYPNGFRALTSTPEPLLGNDIWDLSGLKQGVEKVFTIHGTVEAQDGEERSFHAYAGQQDNRDGHALSSVYNSLGYLLTIRRPFFSATLALNRTEANVVAAPAGEEVQGSLTWRNNLSDRILHGVITVDLSGVALDPLSIKSGRGFYNSKNKQIIWDETNIPALASIGPGDYDILDFSFAPLDPKTLAGTTTPQIDVKATVKGTQLGADNQPTEITGVDQKTVRFSSGIDFSTAIAYYTGPFTNSGPLPPVVEQETTYTVTWELSNPGGSISGASASATLPNYVKYTGKTSPASARLTYNELNHTLSWNIGAVSASSAGLPTTKKVSFQIAFTPSVSQLNEVPIVVNGIQVSATDDFTSVSLKASAGSVLTSQTGDGVVTQ